MANKQPRKPAEQTASIPVAEPIATPVVEAAAPAPVPAAAELAPVADAAPAVAQELPVAAAVAVESVANTISDIRETVDTASLQEKGKTMVETIKGMTENMTAKGEQLFADAKGRTEEAVAKGKALLGDAGEFNKGNMEALVESGKIAAKGFEKLGQEQAEFVRRSFEQSTAAFKTMASVKSPTELMKLHSDYMRASFDAMVAQTSHQTEAMLKLAGEIAQPISNRFAVAAEKVKLAA